MSLESQHPEYQSSARSLSKFAIIKPEHFFPQKFLSQINSPGPGGWGGGGGRGKRLLYASDGTWCTFGLLVSLR